MAFERMVLDSRLRFSRHRGPGERVCSYLNGGESGRLQTATYGIRIDRVINVSLMVCLEVGARQVVTGNKHASWSQDASHLAEEEILKGHGWHVVKHGETRGAAEAVAGEIERSRVSLDDDDVIVACEPVGQHGRELGVDLNGRQLRHQVCEGISRCAVAGADLQDVVAEVDVPQRPGNNGFAH